MTSVFIAGGARTPFGKFGGELKGQTVAGLAVPAITAALDRSRITPGDVDHVVFGNVLPTTPEAPFAARVATLESGMPISTRSLNVNRACGTGVQAIASAAEQILLGRSEVAVAAGAEVFSAAPFALRARWGAKRGTPPMEDMLDWAYRDPFGGQLMGETAEALSEMAGIDRDRQDAYGLLSQQRTQQAVARGILAEEIVPVDGLAADEFPRPSTTADDLANLTPPYQDGGRVTAGTSSGINDGAGAVVVLNESALTRLGVEPVGRIVDWAVAGVEPHLMGRGPVPATEAVFERTGLGPQDMDVAEVNEAFAIVVLHAIDALKLDPERTNPNGGAIAIGHPPGATGLRMTVAALNELARCGGRYGLVTMCLGAGQGMAMIVENLRR